MMEPPPPGFVVIYTWGFKLSEADDTIRSIEAFVRQKARFHKATEIGRSSDLEMNTRYPYVNMQWYARIAPHA